jgi:hypothetical protein
MKAKTKAKVKVKSCGPAGPYGLVSKWRSSRFTAAVVSES